MVAIKSSREIPELVLILLWNCFTKSIALSALVMDNPEKRIVNRLTAFLSTAFATMAACSIAIFLLTITGNVRTIPDA